MLVSLFSFVLGSQDGNVSTSWLLLYLEAHGFFYTFGGLFCGVLEQDPHFSETPSWNLTTTYVKLSL